MRKTMEIRNRWDNSCLWTGEIESTGSDGQDMGVAVKTAILSRANLSRANLFGADLSGADLSRADLSRAKNVELAIARTRILPEGVLIGWKKCEGGKIVKLRIPEDAKRSHAFGRKCRAERAEVLEIIGSGGEKCDTANASHDPSFVYRVGETVVPKNGFSENWQEECEAGIHFYITRLEAENH